EGDKASMEVPTSQAGVVQKIYVALGDSVATGAPIIQISAAAAAPAEQKLPAAPAVQAPVQTEAYTQAAVATPAAPPASEFAANELNEFVENSVYVHASPVVRRLAREFGVDLSKVVPTGLKNRIQKQDVQQYIKAALAQLSNGPSASSNNGLSLLPWPKVDFTQFGEIESVPLSRIKKLSGANLARNWAMIPHVTQFDEADITGLEAFRQEQNSQKGAQIKLTPLVFILKAVAKALQQFPEFNASLSDDGQDLLLKKYINIGVAVDTPAGLVVPVINDVPAKGVVQLSLELAQLSQKARDGKLARTDLQGGCFTISSLGGVGGTAFTPIINAPEVAILGVSKSQHKPVWNGHEFTPRLMLPLSLSFDHRVIDGVQGARFITYLNQCLSDLRLLLL
ncbi:MAG: dihydrolipoyllysine-residue acetyltransferase, partial [Vibrionaceae bacterium]